MSKSDQVVTNQAVFEKIDSLLKQDRPIIIGIDGTAGSGKSSFARVLAQRYAGQLFHMDDFFLPKERKTKARLAEPGGNVDHERFLTDVLEPLKRGESISYQPYDCQRWDYSESVEILPKTLNIIEGVYCFHPNLAPFYDLKLMLTVDPAVQKERLLQREGTEKLRLFLDHWIPLENLYFEAFEIEKTVDLIVQPTID